MTVVATLALAGNAVWCYLYFCAIADLRRERRGWR